MAEGSTREISKEKGGIDLESKGIVCPHLTSHHDLRALSIREKRVGEEGRRELRNTKRAAAKREAAGCLLCITEYSCPLAYPYPTGITLAGN